MPENGLVSVQSRLAARETTDKLLAALAKRKLTVFARIDHAAGAAFSHGQRGLAQSQVVENDLFERFASG